ncbi:hypothetical protein [Arthrobacter sp. ISL-30]|uniref:hypothetical protein n=1 Tax=Arthrobacter sp. ISL-30 TaxID=2819109 RepID=UPI001BED1444|nr:hypothetical protein [Arthrobacter sp. ISL-30]MBT2514795.1 hypothetical protein [Arthrobacter sp. ISL-30]
MIAFRMITFTNIALRTIAGTMVCAAALVLVACIPGPPDSQNLPREEPGQSGTPPLGEDPLLAKLDQFRDNYSRRIVEIQLQNQGKDTVIVRGAEVQSTQFEDPIRWAPGSKGTVGEGTAIPAGQTKSLPAPLPKARCSQQSPTAWGTTPSARLSLQGQDSAVVLPVTDPFGVLDRNHGEMCLEQETARVARLELAPSLEVLPGGETAVMRLAAIPQGGAGSFTIESIQGTTLLAEDPARPWPRNIEVTASGDTRELMLFVQPNRCDAHAVAEDKVGTLIPIHVSINGIRGTLRIPADSGLRGRLYDFVVSACAQRAAADQ